MEDKNNKENDAISRFPFIAGMNSVLTKFVKPIGIIILAILLLSKILPMEYLKYICLFYGAYGLGYHYALVKNKLGHLSYSAESTYWSFISITCLIYFIYASFS